MVTAKCNRCLGFATGKTFDEASSNIDHSVGLTRSIPCGDNYNYVVEVKDASKVLTPKDETKKYTPSTDTKKPKK